MNETLLWYESNIKRITDYCKKFFMELFKRRDIDKSIRDIKKLKSIKPRPYLSHLAMIPLNNIPGGNIINLENLLNLTVECKNIEDYGDVDEVFKKHFITTNDVYYRNYFVTIDNNSYVIIDPIKSWSNIIQYMIELSVRKEKLSKHATTSPDNYYIIGIIDKILIMANKITTIIANVEKSK